MQEHKGKRKQELIDPLKQEEMARKIAAVEARRQKVIDDVELSLKRRRFDRKAIANARLDAEMSIRQREIKDAKKVHGEKMMSQVRRELGAIVQAGIKSIHPPAIIPKKIKYDGRAMLTINDVKYKLAKNVHIVGWGKEAVVTSTLFEKMLGEQVKRGFIVVPRKSKSMMWNYPAVFPKLDSSITFIEVDTREGQPDENVVDITRKIAAYCKRLKKRDLLIVMLSRDTDDLLCYPRDTITLKDKLRVLNRLKAANATPEEINIVRSKLSAIRGGDLARQAYPAKIITLVMSNVSTQLSEQLAGGPCIYDPKDRRALAILFKYELIDKVSQSIRELLAEFKPRLSPADDRLDERKRYKFVQECVVACNNDAVECMATEALKFGLFPVKLNLTDPGTMDEYGEEYAKLALMTILLAEGKVTKMEMYEYMKESPVCPLTDRQVWETFPMVDKWSRGLCLVLGGQLPVRAGMHTNKACGPNQELALHFALYWYKCTRQYPILQGYTVWFAGGGSRGRDGNSDAAGAFGYRNLAVDIQAEYEKACTAHKTAQQTLLHFVEDEREEWKIAKAARAVRNTEVTRDRYAAFLPERILQENNTNLFFSCVNESDELLLKDVDYYALPDVGDLHVIRIVRYQCNCKSTCHAREDTRR